jgi:hypothetical protein
MLLYDSCVLRYDVAAVCCDIVMLQLCVVMLLCVSHFTLIMECCIFRESSFYLVYVGYYSMY